MARDGLERPLGDVAADSAVAPEGRHYPLVPKVLAPRLRVLGRPAALLAQLNQRLPEAMRIEVHPGGRERRLENGPDWRRAPPRVSLQTSGRKRAVTPDGDCRGPKHRVIVAPEMVTSQVVRPFRDDFANVVPDRREERVEGLAGLRMYLAGKGRPHSGSQYLVKNVREAASATRAQSEW